jgi:DUF971 family protein
MEEITRFILQTDNRQLIVEYDIDEGNTVEKNKQTSLSFSYEYLRVFSPTQQQAKTPLIAHQQNVLLTTIESVGRHGYRFIFDDNHIAIFSSKKLFELHHNHTQNWQYYINALAEKKLTRAANISIVNLS